MATTQISDVIVPAVFGEYLRLNTAESIAASSKGLIMHDAGLSAKLAAGGTKFTFPFWNPLSQGEASAVNDDPAVKLTLEKRNSAQEEVVRHRLAKGFSVMSIASILAGSKAMEGLGNFLEEQYWQRELNRRSVATVMGVLAKNKTFTGDEQALFDISALSGAARIFSAGAVIDTAATLGDSAPENLDTIIVHSKIYARMQKDDLEHYNSVSGTNTVVQKYLGKYTVVIDDTLAPIAAITGGNDRYPVVLTKKGFIKFGESPYLDDMGENRSFSTYFVNDAGNGGGENQYFTRRNIAMHPMGYSWIGSSATPDLAALRVASNWERVYPDRRHVPFATLICKVA